MPSQRTFYRTIVRAEILTEDPLHELRSLGDLDHEMTFGDGVGTWSVERDNVPTPAAEAVNLLYEYGSTPDFFRLTETGEDERDEDDDYADDEEAVLPAQEDPEDQ